MIKYVKGILYYTLPILWIVIGVGCAGDDTPKEIVEAPEISGIEESYTLLEGDELKLSPSVTNKKDASYQWSLNGKKVLDTSEFTFTFSEKGHYTLIFSVANKGGKTEKKITIEVLAKQSPPIINNLQESYTIEIGESLVLEPTIVSDSETTVHWLLDGEEVANTLSYNVDSKESKEYHLKLQVTNSVGTTEMEISVYVNPKSEAMSVEEYSILTLKIPDAFDREKVTWTLQNSTDNEIYRLTYNAESAFFVSAQKGEYILEVSDETMKKIINVSVTQRNQKPSPYTAKVFDYSPAPGQFVNKLPEYEEGDTYEDIMKKVSYWLVGEDAYAITLGGWGGSVTIGFDHTIVNVKGKRDFRINGNAFGADANKRPNAPFGGSCEPGIIMVAYDKNKNGKPDDDEWYEIKGSGNFTTEKEPWYSFAKEENNDVRVFRDYEMTYYRPEIETPKQLETPDNTMSYVSIPEYIRWTDNKGNEGYKIKNSYHNQSYYPQWIKDDKITFKGIRLGDNAVNEGKHNPGINESGTYFVLYAFRYGYVDNYPNKHDNSAIDIDWAIDKDGKPANLPGIDFVKIYNGVNKENGWLGEASTEVERGEDLHMLGVSIETIKD